MDKPKSIRIGSTKVRTGCITCKSRRIKCDETKPTCRNCTRSKRPCAYAHNPTGKPNLRIVVYTPRATFATTGAEKHSLDFFLAQMRTRFPIHFSQPVLQAAHREDVLAHAVIALGAMQQVFEFDDASAIGAWSPMATFAMQQYGKALRLLRERVNVASNRRMRQPGAGAEPDLILISCIFFACFECLRGSTAAAIIHMRSGLNLLKEYERDPRTGSIIPRRTMRSLFTRLDNQLIEMRGSSLSMSELDESLDVVARDPMPEDDVHDALNALWNRILHGMLDSARVLAKGEAGTPGPTPSGATGMEMQMPQSDVRESMRQLHRTFTGLAISGETQAHPHPLSHTQPGLGPDTHSNSYSQPPPHTNPYLPQNQHQNQYTTPYPPQQSQSQPQPQPCVHPHLTPRPPPQPEPQPLDYGQDPDILRIWFLLSPMLLTSNTWDPADAWGPHNDNFARIVSIAESYLSRCRTLNPTRRRTFTFSLGIVPPLTLTATRSKDMHVRQKALYLLSICNRREGIWDSAVSVQFALRTIELDQSVSERSGEVEDTDLAATRLKNRAAAFDDILVADDDERLVKHEPVADGDEEEDD
ncbi:hypothetical protein BDW74DRAFT_56153 [Aspergillus multicolor]|uniref:Zn(II)2Cys6 transcription factor n=1 Tax=Aspergillus multicolor TaxID=41759 RepID=UPI003CCC9CDC